MIFREKKLQINFEIVTCDPCNFIMDHSKLIASVQKEEFISALRGLLITIFNSKVWIAWNSKSWKFMLMSLSLNCIYSISCKFHAESTPVKDISNYIEWKKPTADAACSYIDLSGFASEQIRRCLFIDYIILASILKKSKFEFSMFTVCMQLPQWLIIVCL